MNERFVAVSTVTGSRICGCFSKPRCDFSVTRELITTRQLPSAVNGEFLVIQQRMTDGRSTRHNRQR